MNYNILKNKPKIKLKDINGEEQECLDLLCNNFEMFNNIYKIYIVEKYYEARPDLISLAIYKTDKYADILCKFNGISNPFEITTGNIIIIPSIEDIERMISSQEIKPSVLIENENTIKKTIVSLQKKKNEKRSSNEQIKGESNFVIDRTNNIVFY